ncbi:MAG TPA: elongation factor Ts [Candidatus Onthoplasma faecigallinarum]|nr:elongation factor Ts [Candidatus Onthoplasma faecigallinarum]
MNITAKDVANLRDMTGAGMMDCKKALVDAEGNIDKAVELLRERGVAKAAKKESRIAAEGAVGAYVSGNVGVLLEINCESDFVSKGDKFQNIVSTIAKVIAEQKPKDVEALNSCTVEGKSVKEYMTEQTVVIGEKLSIRRFECYQTKGKIETYIHMGGKVGVMVEAYPYKSGEEILHDVALQIAAAKPSYISKNDVPSDVIEKEKEILLVQMQNDEKNANKPREILEKIVTGKIGKYYTENCLLDQPFVKDDSMTVSKLIGDKFTVARFVRWEMGEGLEKRNEDFAAEVAAQTGKN